MRVFIAGGSGLLGLRLVPLLVAAGHDVVAMTRSPAKAPMLKELGATPVVCDVFDVDAFSSAVIDFAPTVVMHSLTHLPEDPVAMSEFGAQHLRTLREGTRNVVAAAQLAGTSKLIAQSIAWQMPGAGGAAYAELERVVLDVDGVVLRHGHWYGPGTWNETQQPPPPRVHIDTAAQRTAAALDVPSGVQVIAED